MLLNVECSPQMLQFMLLNSKIEFSEFLIENSLQLSLLMIDFLVNQNFNMSFIVEKCAALYFRK